jgi:hypothetical protein
MGYTSVSEMRAEGVANPPDDPTLQALIDLATSLVDKYTQRWFEERDLVMELDGTGTPALFLDIPIVSVDSVTVDGDDVPLTSLRIYNRHMQGLVRPDDRENPKIEWLRAVAPLPAILTDGRAPRWRKGQQNIAVDGSFGYTEPDGSTPLPIKRATQLIVVRELAKVADQDAWFEAHVKGRLIEERTRDQSYKLSPLRSSTSSGGGAPELTGDPIIDDILLRYMAPPFVGHY